MHYIFEIRLKPGYTAEQYAEGWLEASRIIQQAPGARGTRLHRKIGEPDVLLAIASWESKARRDEMENTHDPRVQAIIDSQMPHVEFRLIGEFEAPEWEVIPPGFT
ncbi:antibiotic biosynthesis monooxygenase [Pseudohalioglobus sediminis]|uniref:Antibiotic biosynthesis monooxygenase n=1 Tax=Pseudohalioglobus sediminis TaxID=2606449 RepID=A0A5B0X1V1_9GAMM|nr:antibiotic biosynthesis monooxygenase [Pseudohalioglobus sediminis]KAA1192517.1 antibiotic biosynthesis monooxygenase [Pseudohalioglobus sediminis]